MTAERQANHQRSGFTLVELLVVIAIIGVLVALLLPAIQAAREAARRTQCQNHMKQIGLSVLNYESALRELPSGGWGYAWSGDPDMGTGEKQPGGWAFSILPYLENSNVYVVGSGLTGDQKKSALATQKAQPIEVFYCPSRRTATLYFGPEVSKNAGTPDGGYVAKTDYAANGGSYSPAELSPLTWSEGPTNADCMTKFPNCDWNSYSHSAISTYMDGVVLPRIPVELRQITDGTANTIFAAEKYLHRDLYGDGVEMSINSCADNNSLFQGYDWDVIRWATSYKDAKLDYAPQSDSYGIAAAQACAVRYGGPHPGIFYAVFCDNSVRGISFDVDLPELEMMSARDDGGQAGAPPGI